MSRGLYSELAWLAEPPADSRALIKELVGADPATPGLGTKIARLAETRLGDSALAKLGGAIDTLRIGGARLEPLTPYRLGIVGTGTLDLLVPLLVASAARHGVLLQCVTGDYGQIAQEALDPGSAINRAGCDGVLIAMDYRSLPIATGIGDRGDAVQACMSFLDMLRDGFRQHGGAASIVQTLAPPPETAFGSFDRRVAGSIRSILGAVNAGLSDAVEGTADAILDIAALAETVGLAEWYSPQQWNLAKLPFASDFARLYADHVGRLLGALRGKSRRCLILDLDNTVWGGVIGDDGLDGIRVAQGDATGEAFLEVQQTALMLRDRGVVLAVSSKNTDEVARAAFRDHPEMLLRERHIAVFQANWNDKATNIRAIAEELSLGLSSMVFLDDNPVERGLVRQLLPEVAVPELPDDPALYARTLLAAGYFEAAMFSDEDRKRADFYQDNAKRLALQGQVGGVDAYVASLKMEIAFAPFDAIGRERIVQLINKSNQFNLTTRRYSDREVAAIEDDEQVFTLQIRLTDMFADNGMISVVVVRSEAPTVWEIDTWLMSCRVLGRKVEEMVLREIVLNARQHGIVELRGRYVPTDRNGLVRDHYAKLGFEPIDAAPDGTTRWTLPTSADVAEAPMTVTRTYELATAREAESV